MPISFDKSALLNNGARNNLAFKGAKTPSVDDLREITGIVDSKFDNLASNLVNRVKEYAPEMVDINGHVKNHHPLHDFKDSLTYPFLEGLSKLLPDWQPKFLVNHRVYKENKVYERAIRGIYEYGHKFAKKTDNSKDAYLEIEKGFYKKFAANLAPDSARYGSRDERAGTRLVSGLIPAVFLGMDFRNKAIRDGATNDEADKEANKKRGQEIIANVGEAYAQFVMLGGFPMFINNSQMAAPIINTAIGLFFNVVSRLAQGMPLTRVKPENKPVSKSPTMKDFENKLSGNVVEENKDLQKSDVKKKKKEPLLSLKNIALACAASIAAGMALKFGGRGLPKTAVGKFFKDHADSMKNRFEKFTTKELWADKEMLSPFYDALKKADNPKAYWHYRDLLDDTIEFSKDGRIMLGKYEKTMNIMGQELTLKELFRIPQAPFRLVTELVSYPYKAVDAILTQIGAPGFKKAPEKPKTLYNGAMNFVRDHQKYAEKFKSEGKSEQEFLEFYKKHLAQNTLQTLDREGNSKVDNAKMGKLTQLLGTITSIYFATTDDYNRTAKRTGDNEQAERDARERGVNKFMRIITQIALIDVFNQTFKISYAQSLLGAFGVTAACTYVTEVVSRKLSGMPSQQIKTKEEYENYKEENKKGKLSGYYKMIEKLAE